jgi:hypothetical protein
VCNKNIRTLKVVTGFHPVVCVPMMENYPVVINPLFPLIKWKGIEARLKKQILLKKIDALHGEGDGCVRMNTPLTFWFRRHVRVCAQVRRSYSAATHCSPELASSSTHVPVNCSIVARV